MEDRSTRGIAGLARVEGSLRRLRRRAVLALATHRLLLIGTCVLAALVGAVALDAVLRFPEWIRWLHWSSAIGSLAAALALYIWPALRFKPSLTDVALRVEREKTGEAGRLASAVEFANALREGAIHSETSAALARRVVDAEAGQWDASATRGLLRLDHVRQRAVWFFVVAVMTAGIAWISPDAARLGATRALAPWAGVEWPKRTQVVDATGVAVQARGSSIALRAVVTRSNRDMPDTRVEAEFRVVDTLSRPGPVQRAVLTHQRRDALAPDGRAGGLFERLIDAQGSSVEYRLTTLDDATPWTRVRVVEAPAIERAAVSIQPPAYAARAAALVTPTTDIDLGNGLDDRAIAPSALIGSRVSLSLRLNKPLPAPDLTPQSDWLTQTLGPDIASANPAITAAGDQWNISWDLAAPVRVAVNLRDEWGIESAEEAVYRFEAIQDAPATAVVAEPASDINVLPTARVETLGEGRDDVGLTAVWLESQLWRRAGDREKSVQGGALEPESDPAEVARADIASPVAVASVRHAFEIWESNAAPGDELWVWTLAADAYEDADGPRAPTRSGVRRLRVISDEQFVEEIRAELSGVRRNAIRIDEAQAELMQATQARGSDRATRAAQAQIGERLARQDESLNRLAERIETNGLRDDALTRLLEDASQGAQRAGQSSRDAAESLQNATERARRDAERQGAAGAQDMDAASLNESEAREVAQEQQSVRDELAALIDALDAGEDAWATRRQIERLLEEQREAREALRQTANETAGAETSALSPEQREALQQVADRQAEMAERAQKLVEEMPARAEQLAQQDPSAAAGMRRAAQEARAAGVSSNMQQAGQQAAQNQTSEAMASQDRAQRALEQMLEEMEQGERTRREELRRRLASLIESLDGLILQQEAEIARLTDAERVVILTGLDAGMINLNRNTLVVQDDARSAGRELAGVVTLLSRASDAQVRAIGALRETSIDAGAARAAEEESLARLKEARAEAENVDKNEENREQQEKRRELRAAYSQLLEQQVRIRERTGALAALEEPNRRDRAAIRALAEEQLSVRADLAALLEKTQELNDARIFAFAHARADAAAASAAERLRLGEAPSAIEPEDRVVAILQGLVRALRSDPRQDKDDKFSEGNQGGEGSGSTAAGAALIPPLAELVLLREMQAQVAAETRALDQLDTERDVEPLSEAQRQLAEIGKALIDTLNQGGAPAPSPQGRQPPGGNTPR